MHATSVERRPSGKKKAPLAKRASVDDIAAYSCIYVPDGEVMSNQYIYIYSEYFEILYFLVYLLEYTN